MTVAIICEYNPFHNGHKYQIDQIRHELGEDTEIIAIMSGNYTQRGEMAIIPKTYRAKAACLAGVDLVLELPFPYCASSAEIFARSAVYIINSLGTVDYISFGSESGDIEAIKRVAGALDTDEFKSALKELTQDRSLGYPKLCELAYNKLEPESDFKFTPNNILAVEYVRALIKNSSSLKPHTVLRRGASYLETEIRNEEFSSAMSIREALKRDGSIDRTQIPDKAFDAFAEAIDKCEAPTDASKLSSAVISHFRLNPPPAEYDIYDAGDGIYNRLYNASLEANDINSLLKLTESKSYTNARYRRAMWNVFFGVTSSDINAFPEYTQLLAANSRGISLLKKAGRVGTISILTKPSATDSLSDIARRQKNLSDKADMIYELAKPRPKPAGSHLRSTPFIKK